MFNKIAAFICLLYIHTLIAQTADSTALYLFPEENPVSAINVWKQHSGDSLDWKDTSYNDSGWAIVTTGVPWKFDGLGSKGIRWYRKTVFIPEPLDSLQPLAIYARSIVCASQLYWDGYLISQNGRVSAMPDSEHTGLSAQYSFVPYSLSRPGRHVLGVRVSNATTPSGLVEYPLLMGYLPAIRNQLHGNEALLFCCIGIFIITALFHLGFMQGRATGIASALFAALSLSSALFLGIDAAVHFFPLAQNQYFIFALVNDIPWFFMMSLLPAFFLFEFSHEKRIPFSLGIAAIAFICILVPRLIMCGVLPVSLQNTFMLVNQGLVYGVTAFSALLAILNIIRKKNGSILALFGCIAFFAGIVVSSHTKFEYAWAMGFCALIVILMISLSRRMAAQNKIRIESELRSARLELDLLKKHIQPHFLLNSLNSIIAWLEENPQTAATLVNALADELRAILSFSKEKLIPVHEELRLCRLHLTVMGLRRDKQYTLTCSPVPDSDIIPPLVFHTLIENGLTHGCKGETGGVFSFTRESEQGILRYRIFNNGVPKDKEQKHGNGTGLRYVKMRLDEAFPGAWRMTHGPKDDGWEVRIELDIKRIPLFSVGSKS